jgi:hypothetical protein
VTARARAYRTTIEPRRRGGQAIPVPFDPDEAWGAKDRHYVAGTVGGWGIRGSLSVLDGRTILEVGPSWCRDPGVAPGRTVEVVLWPEGPQFDDLPAELADVLEADPAARRRFESLASHYRIELVRPIATAKQPATRERRARQVIEALHAGRQTYR